ncbi:MAG TPA: hypothetical protein VIQ24_18860 [Pyrinomonadaceae bacterium]
MFIAIENYSFQISPKISGCLIAKINVLELVPAFAGVRRRGRLTASPAKTYNAVFWHSPKASAKNMASRMDLSTCGRPNLSMTHSDLGKMPDVIGFPGQF